MSKQFWLKNLAILPLNRHFQEMSRFRKAVHVPLQQSGNIQVTGAVQLFSFKHFDANCFSHSWEQFRRFNFVTLLSSQKVSADLAFTLKKPHTTKHYCHDIFSIVIVTASLMDLSKMLNSGLLAGLGGLGRVFERFSALKRKFHLKICVSI